MTQTLQQAIERLQQMPEERQDALAQLLLHEVDEDERWRQSTAAHAGKLRGLVQEILEADRRRD